MNFVETEIKDLWTIEPKVHNDSRGHFMESFNQREFEEKIGAVTFVQDNEVFSTRGVLRGLHMQTAPYMQAKLVRAVKGEILDVAVDYRKDSPTFLKHVAVHLTSENKKQIFVPHGFLHGYIVLSETALVQYKVDNFWVPGHEFGVRFDDPKLGIDWGLDPKDYVVSEKDLKLGYV